MNLQEAYFEQKFEGAKIHWSSHFDKWVFVHNAVDGLPPHVQQLLLEFEKANPGIQLLPWRLEELRTVFRTLSVEDKASWFGLAPTDETKAQLGFKDIQVVLERIAPLSVHCNDAFKESIEGFNLRNIYFLLY